MSCAISNSPGTAFNSTACNCNSGFTWNSTTSTCYQIGTVTCIDGKILNATSNTCVCDSANGYGTLLSGTCILCSSVSGTSGILGINCVCLSGLTWNSTNGICSCSGSTVVYVDGIGCIDCSTVTTSNKIVNPNKPQ